MVHKLTLGLHLITKRLGLCIPNYSIVLLKYIVKHSATSDRTPRYNMLVTLISTVAQEWMPSSYTKYVSTLKESGHF